MKWYAIYTKPRWEKKVNKLLCKADIVAYLPLIKKKKQYTDRIKEVEEVILPSYVFVYIPVSKQTEVRFIDGVINFVYWEKKVAEISEEEIAALKKYVVTAEYISIEKLDLVIGKEITFKDMLYKNQKAVIERISKNKIEVYLLNLRMKMTINKKQIIYE